MKDVILIPEERIGVIKDKKARREIEETLNVNIEIIDNSVEIEGEDGLKLYIAKNIVKAIGRGFSPVRAMRLLEDEVEFEMLDLSKFSDNKMQTIKSRVIGTNGKTRNYIENSTKCFISVYGKTISLIGKRNEIDFAKEAIQLLIDGAMHKSVYSFLDKAKK